MQYLIYLDVLFSHNIKIFQLKKEKHLKLQVNTRSKIIYSLTLRTIHKKTERVINIKLKFFKRISTFFIIFSI